MRDFAQVKYNGVITEAVAHTALDLMDVDTLGLDRVDRNILVTIIEKFGGGPVGLDTLAASIGEDAGTIEDVYEPYLLMKGLIGPHAARTSCDADCLYTSGTLTLAIGAFCPYNEKESNSVFLSSGNRVRTKCRCCC